MLTMENNFAIFDEAEIITMPMNMFKWIESFGQKGFEQVMESLVQFDNDIQEHDSIVFVTTNPDPEYFLAEIEEGSITMDDDIERDTLVIANLSKIDVDTFLDYVLEGKEIIKNKDLKRIILHYEFV